MKNIRKAVAGLLVAATLGLGTYFLPGRPCWGVGRHEGTKASYWCFPSLESPDQPSSPA